MTDNETIAEFDGYKVRYASDTTVHNTGATSWPLYTKDGKTTDAVFYDSNWQDLMPVWYKFKDIQVNNITNQHYLNACKYAIGHAILYKGPTPSEACRLLAEAIRWYKSIKQ